MPAQLGLEVRADRPGLDEADQAAGEVPFLGPGGQPDGQPPGGDVVDDGAAAVGVDDAVVDETLVQGKVGQRPVLGQPVGGSCPGTYAVIGLMHRSCGVLGYPGKLALGDAGELCRLRTLCLAGQSAASWSGCRLTCCWRLRSLGGWETRAIASGAVRPSSPAQPWMCGQSR